MKRSESSSENNSAISALSVLSYLKLTHQTRFTAVAHGNAGIGATLSIFAAAPASDDTPLCPRVLRVGLASETFNAETGSLEYNEQKVTAEVTSWHTWDHLQ